MFQGSGAKDVETQDQIVTIPAKVIAQDRVHLKVGVFGVNAESVLAIPTLWAELGTVQPGADPSGDPSTDDTLPVWAQIEAKIGDLDKLETTAKNNLVAAVNEALKKGGGSVDEAEIQRIVEEYLTANPPTVEETDPTVPAWAKQPEKPAYTAAEVGALSADTLPAAINTALAQAKDSGAFDGAPGENGYSPTASVAQTDTGAVITVTDKTGTTTAALKNGADGKPGPTGATPNIQIGTVETLEAGSPATASMDGTPENPILNLGIPQGTPGSGGGGGIAVTGATVGQTVKIAAVDDNGVPTAWEPVDLPDGEEWETICEIDGFDENLYMYEVNGAKGATYKKIYLLVMGATANTTVFVFCARGVALPDVYISASDEIAYKSIILRTINGTAQMAMIQENIGFYSMIYISSGVGASGTGTPTFEPLGYQIPDNKLSRHRNVYMAGGIQNIRIYQNNTTVPIPTSMKCRIMGVRA